MDETLFTCFSCSKEGSGEMAYEGPGELLYCEDCARANNSALHELAKLQARIDKALETVAAHLRFVRDECGSDEWTHEQVLESLKELDEDIRATLTGEDE